MTWHIIFREVRNTGKPYQMKCLPLWLAHGHCTTHDFTNPSAFFFIWLKIVFSLQSIKYFSDLLNSRLCIVIFCYENVNALFVYVHLVNSVTQF
jgi:hypothetical protein